MSSSFEAQCGSLIYMIKSKGPKLNHGELLIQFLLNTKNLLDSNPPSCILWSKVFKMIADKSLSLSYSLFGNAFWIRAPSIQKPLISFTL